MLKDIFKGGLSLLQGMAVTFRRLFHPLVTVQYPRKRVVLSPAYRGHIELKIFEDTGTHKCIACGNCERMCPSGVITVRGVKEGPKAPKIGNYYVIDYSKCSLCGLCIESCPTDTLKYSEEYELVGHTRDDCVIDLMARISQGADQSKLAA
ncbi:MAG: NADH-quinone oxidoreductase subunit I [Syntrophobacteraceae bacterium]